MHVNAQGCGEKRLTSGAVPQEPSPLLLETGSLPDTWFLVGLGLLASKPQGSACLHFSSTSDFHVGSGA